jgi:glycosyltransferase involved in cell wall biosynthesis
MSIDFSQDKILLLSVVVPISGMAGRLQNLTTWLSKLDLKDVEVILVHDKLDDKTGQELSDLINRFTQKKIELYEVHFQAPGPTRNFGIEKAKGKWIQFVDSDDLPDIENSLELTKCAPQNAEVIRGMFSYYDVKGQCTYAERQGVNPKAAIALNPGLWRFIFLRESLKDLRFTNFRMGEDQLFLLEYKIFSRVVHYSSLNIYTYYLNHSGQLTSQRKAIKELSNVITLTGQIYAESDSTVERYIAIMLVRQLLTYLRNFPFSSLNWGSKLLFGYIFEMPKNKLLLMLTACLTVFRNRSSKVAV